MSAKLYLFPNDPQHRAELAAMPGKIRKASLRLLNARYRLLHARLRKILARRERLKKEIIT